MLSKNEIARIRGLHRKSVRTEEGLFTVEGDKIVAELLDSSLKTDMLLVTEKSSLRHREEARIITEKEMERISTLISPSPSLAVARLPEFEDFRLTGQKLYLVPDDIRDPGNLGTIIRTAEWFGLSQLVLSPTTVEVFNPKTIQSSMGSVFRVNCVRTDIPALFAQYPDMPRYAMAMDGKDIRSFQPEYPCFLIVGNEANGISEDVMQTVTERVSIPGSGRAESLNAAVAAAIGLFMFSRI
jgi:RNA methyltransferase, TrmH family